MVDTRTSLRTTRTEEAFDLPLSLGWTSPDSVVADPSDVAPPRCPLTRRTMRDYDSSAERHVTHKIIEQRKELAKKQRGKSELSEAQIRMLFDGTADPLETLEAVAGHKYTKRQSAQVKMLKKLAAGKSQPTQRTFKTKEQGRRRTRCQKAHNRVLPDVESITTEAIPRVPIGQLLDNLEIDGIRLVTTGADGTTVFLLEGINIIAAA